MVITLARLRPQDGRCLRRPPSDRRRRILSVLQPVRPPARGRRPHRQVHPGHAEPPPSSVGQAVAPSPRGPGGSSDRRPGSAHRVPATPGGRARLALVAAVRRRVAAAGGHARSARPRRCSPRPAEPVHGRLQLAAAGAPVAHHQRARRRHGPRERGVGDRVERGAVDDDDVVVGAQRGPGASPSRGCRAARPGWAARPRWAARQAGCRDGSRARPRGRSCRAARWSRPPSRRCRRCPRPGAGAGRRRPAAVRTPARASDRARLTAVEDLPSPATAEVTRMILCAASGVDELHAGAQHAGTPRPAAPAGRGR